MIQSIKLTLFSLLLALLWGCTVEETPLIQTVKARSYYSMEELLKSGVDPNEHSNWYATNVHASAPAHHTALTVAAGQGDARAVEILLRYKANPLIKSGAGFTPLEYALQYKHIEIAKQIWQHEPHDRYMTDGTAALLWAAWNRDGETYDYFRSQIKYVGAIRNVYYLLAHHTSATNISSKNSTEQSVKFLLERGERAGVESLCAAVVSRNPDMLPLLLKAGANPDERCDPSILDLALSDLSGSTVDTFKFMTGNTPLMLVQTANNLDLARALLDGGADINALNANGQNALMNFLAKLHIVSKSEFNLKNPTLGGSLELPTKSFKINYLPMLDFYLENGSRMDIKDKNGKGVFDLINDNEVDADFIRTYLAKPRPGKS